MIVYVDLIFFLNFLMDGMILLAAAWSRRIKVKIWRIAAAAALGSGYAVWMLLSSQWVWFTFVVKCIFSLLMIMTAFGFGSLQNFLGNLSVFYFINFVVAGGIFGIHYIFQSPNEILNGLVTTRSGGFAFQIKIGLLFIGITASGLLIYYRSIVRGISQRRKMGSFLAEVQISVGTVESRCVGLIDTGNQLYDPLTRTPVMIVEAALWEGILPDTWLRSIRTSQVEQLVAAMDGEDFAWRDRLRLVPYRGVNRGTQFMLAFKPDKVVITHNDLKVEAGKVLIGMDGGKLCSDGSYQAIIHPTLVDAAAG